MAYRNAQVYVQSKTARLLRLVANMYPRPKQDEGDKSFWTPDEIADDLLQKAVAQEYPLAVALAKEQDRLEKEFFQKARDGK